MKKLLLTPILLLSLSVMASCAPEEGEIIMDTELPTTPDAPEEPDEQDNPEGPDRPQIPDSLVKGRTLVAYFSAQGNTKAVSERIVELIGADIYRIEAAEPYAENPYDDSDRIQQEAYNDLRPAVANPPAVEKIAEYDTIFIGSPCWWHQPAMVVCTFLESYDLKAKVIIPFLTYGSTTYLNESLQKIYKITPDSRHIPETLPEDLDPDDITTPGRPDDAGIDMPGHAGGTEAWLKRLGIL